MFPSTPHTVVHFEGTAIYTLKQNITPSTFPPHSIPALFPQYLGKTHNFWHGSAMLLEQRAYKEGELPAKSKEPPDYDGKYTDHILDPLKHVCNV